MCADIKGPKNFFGTLVPVLLGLGAWPNSGNTQVLLSYHAELRCCSSKRIGDSRGSQKIGDAGPAPLRMGACLTSRNTPLTNMCYLTEFDRSTWNGWCVRRSSVKVWPFASRPSRSLKVIGTDTDRSATYKKNFLLVFHSNYLPISYRFRDKWQHLPNFPAPYI